MYGEGARTTEVFTTFLREVLVAELKAGDVVVMDNLGAHKPPVVTAMIEAAGAAALFLPPYAPELNPIENAWSKMKNYVRALAPQSLAELHDAIIRAVHEVSAEDAVGWFRHCGYQIKLKDICA